MKKFIIALLIITVSGCAQSGYRDRYGYDGYGYADNGHYYGYSHDSQQSFDDWGRVGVGLSLNWNAFPDRYGITYGAVINGPYRYPRVGFYYRNNWYPSAWWGSYSAFDPWYSDYYYSRRHSGTYLSLSFNFYDFDGGWYTGWYDPWPGSWGYGLAYNWFQPFHGWRHHPWSHWSTPWHGAPHYRNHYSGDHRRHNGGWTSGPGYRPHYRNDAFRHRHSGHSSTRSEAARLAARRSAQHSRDTYRRTGRVDGHERYRPHNNPRNVVTRQYKRPAERQRSTRSTHRYNRIPATSQPFYGQTRTTVRHSGRQPEPAGTYRRYQRGNSRLVHSDSRRSRNNPRHAATRSPSTAAINRHARKPSGRHLTTARSHATGQQLHTNTPVRSRHQSWQRTQQKPLIRHVNRYRTSPSAALPLTKNNDHNRYRPAHTPAPRARLANPTPQRQRQKIPTRARPAANHTAPQLNSSPNRKSNTDHSSRTHPRAHYRH